MIGLITGTLIEKLAPYLIVDVQGVGYEIQAPMTTFYKLPQAGESIRLFTHFSVSETAQQLFGFVDKFDRELFRLLIKVNGVGPKMAIGIMSIESAELITYVRSNNIAALVKVPGVGKKTAERLLVEMRDKIKALAPDDDTETLPLTDKADSPRIVEEAESALVALGYRPAEAAKAINRAYSADITRSEELIRLALKSMMPA